MQLFKGRLQHRKDLGDNTSLYLFRIENPPIVFTAGQYIMISIPGAPPPNKRLYSIASPPQTSDHIELFIKHVAGGRGSSYLLNLSEGDEVDLMGPAGQFFLRNTSTNKVFLTTGTGIAPIRSFILSAPPRENVAFHLFWGTGTRTTSTGIVEEICAWQRSSPFLFPRVCLSKENPPAEQQNIYSYGRVQAVWEKTLGKIDHEFYICGRREMVEETRLFLLKKGVGAEHIFFERY